MRRIVTLIGIFIGSMSFAANEPRVVRFGGSPMPPLVQPSTSGQLEGVIPPLIAKIAEQHNWQVEWIMDNWSMQLDRLRQQKIDVMTGIGYSDARGREFDFSEQSVLNVWGQLYTQPNISAKNFLDLDQRKIAVLRNGISGIRFAELCRKFGVDCIIKPMNSYDDVFRAIDDKKVAAGVVNSLYGYVYENQYNVARSDVMFNPFPVLFATKKGQNKELLNAIDQTLSEWKKDNNSVYYSITDQWVNRQTSTEFPQWLTYTLVALATILLVTLLMIFLLRREVQRRTQELSLSEAQLKQIINLVPHAIFATDATGKVILANLATTRVFNLTTQELRQSTRAQLMHQQPYLEGLLGDDEKVMGRQVGNVNQEVEVCKKFGDSRFFQLAKVPFVRKKSHIPAVVSVAVDITEQKLTTERIEHLAKHDELTDLPNRSLLMDRLAQAMALSKRHHRIGAVVFVDLDLFKNVNDTLGHSVGDVLLQVTAARIRKHCRESDTVARFGGDEYVVLLSELGETFEEAKTNALLIARKIRKEVIKETIIGRHEISISISQGIVFFPYDAEEGDEAIKRADLAMYHAKSMGRNKIVIFHQSMEESIKRKEKLKVELRQAINQKDLFLVYQPQFDTRTNSFRGCEALVRWDHRQEHIIFPLEFIPIAEESGSIIDLGEYVLNEACEQAMQWRDQFKQDFYVTINLSAKQIAHKSLIPYIDKMIKRTGIPVELIELEVTESMLMMDMDRAVEVLSILKAKGIKISLDDFGTGYSSLSYLKKLPLDKLKIDKSFVNDIPGDKDSEAIAKTIISMANQLGLEVVAEGIENARQVKFFTEHGCYLFQGHYFSPPCRAKELIKQFDNIIPFDKSSLQSS